MDENKGKEIKLQEWVVRFDGSIKQSEKSISSDVYHNKMNNNNKRNN